jgi:uncharacterized RDD family membrane protein YckC
MTMEPPSSADDAKTPTPESPRVHGDPPPAGGMIVSAPFVVPNGMFIDQQSGLVLPQGVQLATAGRRIGAYFLSLVLVIVTLIIGYVIWGLIAWGRGTTPALQVLGMRCWRPETNRVAGFWWMALREIVGRIAENILAIVTALVSLILMMSRKDRKSLHDLIAGTVVVYDPNKVLDPTRGVSAALPAGTS